MSTALTKLDVPTNPLERRSWVVARLKEKQTSLRQLALSRNLDRRTMSEALLRPNSRCEPVIAAALGLTVQELFPERFDQSGQRRFGVKPKSRVRRNVQNVGVA